MEGAHHTTLTVASVASPVSSRRENVNWRVTGVICKGPVRVSRLLMGSSEGQPCAKVASE